MCFIHPNCIGSNKEFVRAEVCKGLPANYNYQGNNYCVLHLPDETKVNNTDFLERINSKIQNKQNNFSYIFVPNTGTFFSRTFSSDTSFDDATFHCQADFRAKRFEHKISFKNTIFIEKAIFTEAKFENEVSFHSATFNKDVDFDYAKFKEITHFVNTTFLGHAGFSWTKFYKVVDFADSSFQGRVDFLQANFLNVGDFRRTIFNDTANFLGAIFEEQGHFFESVFFQKADFSGVTFNDNVSFNQAKFEGSSKTFFRNTLFNKAACSFFEAEISGYIHFVGGVRRKRNTENIEEIKETGFIGDESYLNLQKTYIEKPERISFHSIELQPSWFINVDSRKFIFTNVEWNNLKINYKNQNLKAGLESLKERRIEKPEHLFKIACRQLAENAENNNNYEIASNFRRMAMELEWFEKKENLFRHFKYFKFKYPKSLDFLRDFRDIFIHKLYRISSSYGERWGRALVVLILILFCFALIYTQTNFEVCVVEKTNTSSVQQKTCKERGLDIWEASRHSLATAAFQNVDNRKPISGTSETFIVLEKIFAPIQIALLALAIRRKFMR